MPELRKCKECGKMFMPKGREQYCSDVHYRPCPVCGAPVIAKYLSDPPRKCDNCKHHRSPQPKVKTLFNIEPETKPAEVDHEVEPESSAPSFDSSKILAQVNLINSDTVDQSIFCETMSNTVKTYIGNWHGTSYFIPGHQYLIHVEHNEYTYRIIATEDITVDESVKIITDYASQISFKQNFAIPKN